jgi:CRP-like cAMP-binding protein
MALEPSVDVRQFARAVGTPISYAADDVIFREGDPPNFVYVILAGSVEISIHGKVIESVHEGEALGLMAILDDKPRTITARAREKCELALLDKRKFRYMVEEIPNFVWFVMEELAHRLRVANAAI